MRLFALFPTEKTKPAGCLIRPATSGIGAGNVKNTRISKLKITAAPLALGLALISTPSFAQDQAAADEEEAGESIVVTGSRIARPDLEAPSPVTTVSGEQISLTGTVTLEELINDLPSIIPGNNRTSNNSGGEDFATLDLRGLGPTRTLILVDGERLAASSTTGAIDISQIPGALIERIDVVTGGATAVYGSDAIAGVVNFILKDDFSGVKLTAQAEVAGAGVGFNHVFEGVFGGNFDDGRGNLVATMQYYDRDSVGQSRFGYSRTSGALGVVNGVLRVVDDPSDLNLANGDFVIFSGGSATTVFGQVAQTIPNLTSLGGNFASFDSDCNPATPNVAVNSSQLSFTATGQLRPYSSSGSNLCGIPVGGSSRYNFAPDNNLLIPFDRLNTAIVGSYEFSDKTEAKLFVSYAKTTSEQQLAPTPAAGGTGFTIAANAPTIPANLAAALALRANPAAPFLFNRRFGETGPRVAINDSQQIQARVLVEHKLSDNWSVNVLGSFGRTDFDVRGIGNINRTAVEQGVNGCVNSAGVLRGPGILPGCVSVNIFGFNTITPDAVRFIKTDTYDSSEFEQVRTAVNLTGSLFELPGGPLGIAVGAEYRKDTGVSTPDDAKVRGEIIGFNQENPLGGSITAKEVYGEIRAPILGGDGFPELLAFEAGVRYSNYSSVGNLFNYKLGAEFAPFSFLKFRGSYNKAARAPSVFELFQAGDQGFPSYQDPCNQSNAARNTAFCQSQFTAAGASAALVTGFAQSNQQVQAFAFGNPDLREEDAETWTVGAVLTPSSFPLGRFSATVDYYNIKITDLNAAQGAQFFINSCYNAQNAAACARIVRNPLNGQIDRVNTTRVNGTDPLKTSGIDVGINWTIPMEEIGVGGGGRVNLQGLLTWVDSYKIGATEFVDLADSGLGGITSEWASTVTASYQTDRFTGQLRWIYKSGGDQSGSLFGPDDVTGFRTPRVPDLNVFDLQLRYRFGDRFTLSGIVNNLFNKFPPQTAVGTFEQANTNVSFYSPLILGRSFTLQASIDF
jgi:iron complex outermembrane recepter protein